MKTPSRESERRNESRKPRENGQEKEDRWIESDAATRHPNLVRFSRRVGDRGETKNDR